MTKMSQAIPTYFMPAEKRAFARGFRDGAGGKPLGTSKAWPQAYSRGYWEGAGVAVKV